MSSPWNTVQEHPNADQSLYHLSLLLPPDRQNHNSMTLKPIGNRSSKTWLKPGVNVSLSRPSPIITSKSAREPWLDSVNALLILRLLPRVLNHSKSSSYQVSLTLPRPMRCLPNARPSNDSR